MNELKFSVKEVLPMLSLCGNVVSKRNSLPILDNILFEGRGNGLLATTSDNDVWLSVKIPLVEGVLEKPFCVNATSILNAFNNLDDKVVVAKIDESSHTIRFDYGTGHFVLPFVGGDEFPRAIESKEGAKEQIIESEKVLRAIKKTSFAIANNELRPVINGIHFDFFNDKMVCVATDAYKLAKYCDETVQHAEETYSVTIPTKACILLKNILPVTGGSEVKFVFSDKCAIVNNVSFKMTSRIIDGRYPNYDMVIPNERESTCDIDRKSLISAVKRVLPMGNDTSELVSLSFTAGNVVVGAEDVDFSTKASETVVCDYQGKDLMMGFKGSSLIQVLSNIDDDNVVIDMIDSNKATIIYGLSRNEYLSLIMPMIIS